MPGIHYITSAKRLEEMLKHHMEEIKIREQIEGFEIGRLNYAVSILSDIQGLVKCNPEAIDQEAEEVKALILSVTRKMLEEKGEEIHDM